MLDLRLGDCRQIMPTLPEKSFDLVFADLPYGTTRAKWDSVIPFNDLWPEFERLIKPNGCVVFTASQPFTSFVVTSKVEWFRCEWIWKKNAGSNFGSVRFQPMKEHESVLVFSPQTSYYSPIMQERAESGKARVKTPVKYETETEVYGTFKSLTVKRPDLRFPSSVQTFNRERGLHPTQKPVALLEYLIKTYTPKGGKVLDPVMGSGTTLVACHNAGRDGVGIEIDSTYFRTSQERIHKLQGVV